MFEDFKSMCGEIKDWLLSPVTKEWPISKLLLIVGIFVIVAFILYDGTRILKSWMDSAAETIADAA